MNLKEIITNNCRIYSTLSLDIILFCLIKKFVDIYYQFFFYYWNKFKKKIKCSTLSLFFKSNVWEIKDNSICSNHIMMPILFTTSVIHNISNVHIWNHFSRNILRWEDVIIVEQLLPITILWIKIYFSRDNCLSLTCLFHFCVNFFLLTILKKRRFVLPFALC